jgi:hypothetical protein
MRVLRLVLPAFMLLGLVPILTAGLPWMGVRAAVVVGMAMGVGLAWPLFMGRSKLERMMGFCLFLGPALLISGIQMAAGDTLLAFPLIGASAMVAGVKEHMAFRRLERELTEPR